MNISVIGGDSRIVELVKLLAKDENELTLFGLGKCTELEKFKHASNLDEALQEAQLVITSIPLSKNGVNINTVYTEKTILIEDFFEKSKNKKIITGNITEEIQKRIKPENKNEIIDILKSEELTIMNAIPTAEGAIQIAMEKSKITLHNSKCLVLGFGRIGKILSKMLIGIGANVYCEARKTKDIAWIKSYGYNAIDIKELGNYLNKFDFIFNTIPHLILNEDKLNLIKKECLLIDLASKPGGIDFEKAKELNLQVEWALALPGKVAPKTAAVYIYNILDETFIHRKER
ncbi:MAG: dipicolinate synthase subunit DpsA [Clostridia bacterium]|nr:dipicolinate synthase subunit DpsA [Clostridia bacterium]